MVAAGNANRGGRLSTVNLLVLTCLGQLLLILKILFTFLTKQAALMRRSTVLSLAPQLVFPCCRLGFISKYYTWLKSNMTGKHSSLFVRSISDAGKKV
jgi:hypothetical protein